MLTQEEISKAKQAYDLEVKDTNVSTAVSAYINILEEECKKYREWWISSAAKADNLQSDNDALQADVDYYRSIIAHEFNRK